MTGKLYKFWFIVLFLLPVALVSCNEDDLLPDAGNGNGELPVKIFAQPPIATRANTNPKKAFAKEDVIHIEGIFYMGDDTTSNYIVRYGAFEYDGKNNWLPVAGSGLTWPNQAKKAKFRAFYVDGLKSVLTTNTVSPTFTLSSLKSNTDPLYADWTELYDYGHAANLQFSHLLAYLSLESVNPIGNSTQYFLERTNSQGASDPTFNNAFQLSVNSQNRLEFRYTRVADPKYDNAVFVGSSPSTVNGKELANFFLQPGNYSSFKVYYPGMGSNYTEYFQYNYDPGADLAMEHKPDLEGNRTYTIDIASDQGVIIVIPEEKEENWDDEGGVIKVDVGTFLYSVYFMEDYIVNGEKVLEKTASGVRMLHNVNFHDTIYSDIKVGSRTFYPTLPVNQIFDGQYHYINNVGCCIFKENEGSIANVGIRDARYAELVTDKRIDYDNQDYSRKGLIIGYNKETGVLNNVRVQGDINVTGKVKVDEIIDQETHNQGLLVGSNVGHISDIYLSGNLALTVQNYVEGQDINVSVTIGGIVGQNAGTGTISNITRQSDMPYSGLTVRNKCSGRGGAFYVGGFVGLSTSNISDIDLGNITVDCSQSSGVTAFIGGMAGQLSSDASPASITNCNATGSVTAGESSPYGSVICASYTGGIAGALQSVTVSDCQATFIVRGYNPAADIPNWEKLSNDAFFATGGAFGRIRTKSTIRNLKIYVRSLYGYVQEMTMDNGNYYGGFVGNFAGMVPSADNWGTFSSQVELLNIISGYPEIGKSLDSI